MTEHTQSPEPRYVDSESTSDRPVAELRKSDTGTSAGDAAARQDVGSVTWPSAIQPKIRQKKTMVSLRLDRDVREWFRDQGFYYQTRMNAVLRAYVERARADAGEKQP